MPHLKAFVAGFLSTLFFHQGLLLALHAAGLSSRAPFDMTATAPLGVPAVVSLACWGGVWGVLLCAVIGGARGARYWGEAAVIGAVLPSLVTWFVVLPLKGKGIAGGWDPAVIATALMLNATWGIGVGFIVRLLNRVGRW